MFGALWQALRRKPWCSQNTPGVQRKHVYSRSNCLRELSAYSKSRSWIAIRKGSIIVIYLSQTFTEHYVMICQLGIMLLVKYPRCVAFYGVSLLQNYIFKSRTKNEMGLSQERWGLDSNIFTEKASPPARMWAMNMPEGEGKIDLKCLDPGPCRETMIIKSPTLHFIEHHFSDFSLKNVQPWVM